MNTLKFILGATLTLFSFLPFITAYGETAIELRDIELIDVKPYTRYLVDADQTLSPEQAYSKLAEFEPIPGDEINFGRSDSRYWFFFEVHNNTGEHQDIVIRNFDGWLEQFTVYEVKSNEIALVFDDSLKMPFEERNPSIRKPAFSADFAPDEQRGYLVSVVNPYVASVTLMIGSREATMRENNIALLRFAVFAAIMGALILINLFYGLVNRQLAFVTYALLQLSAVFYALTLEGFGFQLLWSNAPALNGYMLFVAAAICQFFLALFSISFLSAENVSQTFHRWLQLITLVAAIHIPMNLVFTPAALTNFSALLSIVLTVTLVAYGVLALRSGDIAARYYLLGWGMVFAVVFFFGFSVVGFVPVVMAPTVSVLAIEVVFVVEALCFALGLAHRYRMLMASQVASQQALIKEQAMRLTDAKEKAALEEDREAALREAFESARRLAVTGHDIAQPLSSLRLALDQMSIDGNSTALLSSIQNTIDDIEEQMREATQDSTTIMRQQITSVESILNDVTTRFQSIALDKDLYLRAFINADKTNVDRLHLIRCLSNLVSNAIHNTTAGGILIAARMRANGLLFQVFDTGSGMTEVELERFQQALESGSGSEGYGLGLTIVDELCRVHNWHLDIRSTPNRGTCVSVLVPET